MVETSSYEEIIDTVNSFKQMLVSYYESGDIEDLANWIAKNCLQGTTKVTNLENMNYF